MEAQRSPDDGEKEKGFLWQVVQIMLIIWTFLCELPEILTLVSTCSCFKPVVAYFKRNFMRVNFIGSSHIYYHKSNYLSLTTILTHRDNLNRVKCSHLSFQARENEVKCLHSLMIIMDWFLGQHNPSNYFALTMCIWNFSFWLVLFIF